MKSRSVLWILEQDHALQERLMVCAQMQLVDEVSQGRGKVASASHRSSWVWSVMEKHVAEFVRSTIPALPGFQGWGDHVAAIGHNRTWCPARPGAPLRLPTLWNLLKPIMGKGP